jgi:hypothetical protein
VHGYPALSAWVSVAATQPPVAPKKAMAGLGAGEDIFAWFMRRVSPYARVRSEMAQVEDFCL